MKTRPIMKFAGLMIALIFLFAALPLQAWQSSWDSWTVSNFTYDGVDSNSGKWKLSWNTVGGEYWAYLQFRGGGITNVWTSVSSASYSRSGGKTRVEFSPLSNDPAGKTFKFRVKVDACIDQDEAGCITATSDWAYVDATFT